MFAFQTRLTAEATGLRVDAKAQAEQVRSAAVERLGRVPAALLAQLDDALRLHRAL